jgi:hypothetical protein
MNIDLVRQVQKKMRRKQEALGQLKKEYIVYCDVKGLGETAHRTKY